MPASASSSPRKSRYQLGPFQFGIGHVLAAMLAAVVVFTCVGGVYREGVARKGAEKLLEELGGKLAIAPARRGRTDPYRRSLSFIKPLDDAAARRLAPYAQWFTGVVELDLQNTRVTGGALASFREMPHLETLILDGTAIDDEGLTHLGGHARLSKLSLAKTKVSDEGMQHLSSIAELKDLSLSDTAVGDRGLEHLAACGKLESLELASTPVTHEGLVFLRALRNLKSLDLSNTPIDDQAMSSIKRLASLEELNLSRTSVTAQIIPSLEHLEHLKELHMLESKLEDGDLERLRRALPKLDVIDKPAPAVAPGTAPPGTTPAPVVVPMKGKLPGGPLKAAR